MQNEDLLSLLEESRSWNRTHEITGILLYVKGQFPESNDGRFIQVLEGPENEVKDIFEKIRKDKRHYSVTLLSEAPIKKRNFLKWEMGFELMDHEGYKAKPGFFELNENYLNSTSSQKMNMPLHFLKSFYTIHGASNKS